MVQDKETPITAEEEINEPEQVKTENTENTEKVENTESACEGEKSSRADKKKIKKLEESIAELEKKLEEKDNALAEQNDKYLRTVAEYDNFRKRSAKERDGIYADAYSDALTSILPIIDNLERATGYTDADSVLKGVQMILKSADEVLEKMGVEKFGEKGDTFDPNMHNAVMHIEDESLGENVIVEVFQKGYKKGGKIIRYAMVQTAN